MSAELVVFAALLVILGIGTLVCVIGWWWSGRGGPPTAEREAVEDAPMVVAGDDLVFQASLDRMQRELDALLAYGEGR